ncbi:MAG: Hsp20/alpha crystallin family protein [Terriglobales bacterium]
MDRVFSQAPNISGRDIGDIIWVPPIEVEQRDGNFVVSAELPGIPDEDIQVEVTDDALIIRGERQIEHEENERGIRRTERRYGQFYRAIPLPDGADPDKAKAELQNGVLRVTVPVSETKSGTRQIPVQTSQSGQQSGQQQSKEQKVA